jgi:enediyne biosynthesis protein E4
MRVAAGAWLWMVACSDRDDGRPDTGSSTGNTSSPSPLIVEEGGLVTCVAPATRSVEGPYSRREASEQVLQPQEAQLLGGGLAVEDYDGDGFLDLFLPSDDTSQLWFGRPDTFFDELAATALAGVDLTDAVGASNVDFDADGDVDLLVTRWERSLVLLRNDGQRRFSDATPGTGLDTYATKAQSASWADIDRDGDLDLFVGSYGEFTDLNVDEPSPDCGDHIPDPVAAQLWINDGDGTFTDAKHLIPDVVQQGYIFMSGFYDIDGDSYPELFTAHDDGRCSSSTLLDNVGGSQFLVDDTDPLPSDAYPGPGFHLDAHDMGMGVADLNGDEVPDFVLTSWQIIHLLESRADNPEIGLNGVYWLEAAASYGLTVEVTPESGDPDQTFGWGTEFADVDNDADLDLVATFGYWSTYDGPSDPLWQPDALWIQEGGVFTDQAPAMGLADDGMGRGLVFADLNGDGFPDLVKRQLDRETAMYISNCDSASWVEVRLAQPGANPRGIGAKIRVQTPDGAKQLRWLSSGSTGLYSGSPLSAHFGVADADTVDIEVVWPDGSVGRAEGVSTRQRVTLRRAD